MSSRIEALFERAKIFYENGDPSHDVLHIRRVMQNCCWLAKNENVNLEILLAAAILHDIVNLPKNHPERLQASQLAASRSTQFLEELKFAKEEISKISGVIVEHSFSLGKKPSSIESKILQDAVKLDALGSIGIMRTVSCGSQMGTNYYSEDQAFAVTRELNDKAFTIDHFFTKLLKLPDLMNTKLAKEEATRRAKFMTEFLSELKRELAP